MPVVSGTSRTTTRPTSYIPTSRAIRSCSTTRCTACSWTTNTWARSRPAFQVPRIHAISSLQTTTTIRPRTIPRPASTGANSRIPPPARSCAGSSPWSMRTASPPCSTRSTKSSTTTSARARTSQPVRARTIRGISSNTSKPPARSGSTPKFSPLPKRAQMSGTDTPTSSRTALP